MRTYDQWKQSEPVRPVDCEPVVEAIGGDCPECGRRGRLSCWRGKWTAGCCHLFSNAKPSIAVEAWQRYCKGGA